jgi:hypothetical protein
MGLSKATQDRRRSRHQVGPPADPAARPVPVNKLSDAESAELIAVLNAQRLGTLSRFASIMNRGE